jgi:hypothetical protein
LQLADLRRYGAAQELPGVRAVHLDPAFFADGRPPKVGECTHSRFEPELAIDSPPGIHSMFDPMLMISLASGSVIGVQLDGWAKAMAASSSPIHLAERLKVWLPQ